MIKLFRLFRRRGQALNKGGFFPASRLRSIKRLIAVCVSLSFCTFLQTALPAASQAAGTETPDAMRVHTEKASSISALATQSVECDMQIYAQREVDIVAIRAQYEGSVEIDMLAKIIYREARGVKSDTEKAAVVWCVLNRVDDSRHPNTIKRVITQKHQFAWVAKTPVQQNFKDLALDVVIRWELEKRGYADVGRILPSDYLFFAGRRGHNWFRNKYRCRCYWDWSLYSPYENGEQLLSIAYPCEDTEAYTARVKPDAPSKMEPVADIKSSEVSAQLCATALLGKKTGAKQAWVRALPNMRADMYTMAKRRIATRRGERLPALIEGETGMLCMCAAIPLENTS